MLSTTYYMTHCSSGKCVSAVVTASAPAPCVVLFLAGDPACFASLLLECMRQQEDGCQDMTALPTAVVMLTCTVNVDTVCHLMNSN